MLKELFKNQHQYLTYFYEHLDLARAEEIVNFCLQIVGNGGLLVLTGVGKSGIIAEKIAMTLISTGTKALYLPAINFLHGDIGIISEGDCVIMLSKSGETEELLNLIPFFRKRGCKVMAWVSKPHSRLSLESTISIVLPVQKELCPFDLAPTISTEIQLLFGDALTIALMKKKGFSLASYGDNHPSGMIGKKAMISVESLMVPFDKLPLCPPSGTLKSVLREFSEKRLGCVIVVDDGYQLQGIFTDGDLRRSLESYGPQVMEKKLEELMVRSAVTINVNEMAWEALKLMQKNVKQPITALPVLKDGRVVGLIHIHHIIGAGIS